MVKTIIAGSRGISGTEEALDAIFKSCGWVISEVVSGTARGVDKLGEEWAERKGIPVKRFPADWNKHGKSAGYLRNVEMGEYADALLALWDGESRGTKHMIDIMNKLGKPVKLVIVTDEEGEVKASKIMQSISHWGMFSVAPDH
jgi:hypothetical protein